MENAVDELLKKTFIKLRSDYGFKRAFATPQNAEVLRKFLNALFAELRQASEEAKRRGVTQSGNR